jgi:hypothetical protein
VWWQKLLVVRQLLGTRAELRIGLGTAASAWLLLEARLTRQLEIQMLKTALSVKPANRSARRLHGSHNSHLGPALRVRSQAEPKDADIR